MTKNARHLSAAISLSVACHAAVAEPAKPIILKCSGVLWGEGIDAPKDEEIPGHEPNLESIYTMDGSTLTESGGGISADTHYALCSSTNTNYLFSTDCSVQRQQYVMNWLQSTTGEPENASYFKKHPSSTWGLEIVSIDRVNLRVDEEFLVGHSRAHWDKASNHMVFAPFLVSIRYSGNCAIAQPKL
ncbi:hypothetical protein PWR66_05475 [Paraburkholderia sp. A1RO-5]|uniref:hypothetical protein n=1 Tax=Paraburkholderia sp. A1RO-5 TaxID=3028369 RepID=UPI003B80D2D7